MATAIRVDKLLKRYEQREVVKGISFEVKAGEIFGFLGPNGAGKTTSIRMMIGEIPPDGGAIEILGLPMPDRRDDIKQIMGVVPDHQNLYDRLTVRQNLEFFTRLYDVPATRVDELLEMVHLTTHADHAAIKLSRGLRQRTLIARGILHQPKVFFLDEPTSALDPQSALGIRNVIRTLKSQGTTVFITTHYMEEANQLCDRIAIMHQGQVVAVDTPEALRLRHGKATLKVTLKGAGSQPLQQDEELPLGEAGADQLAQYLKEGRVLKVHSQEATLEEVFLNLTGDLWKPQESEARDDEESPRDGSNT